jgi:hypothetical protein
MRALPGARSTGLPSNVLPDVGYGVCVPAVALSAYSSPVGGQTCVRLAFGIEATGEGHLERQGLLGFTQRRRDAKIYYGSLFAIELVPSLRLCVLSEAGETIITIPTPASAPHARQDCLA